MKITQDRDLRLSKRDAAIIRSWISAMLLVAAISPPLRGHQAPAGDATRLLREGGSLSREDADRLEETLKTRPDDMAARVQILGYYFGPALRQQGPDSTIQARRRNILWVIRNHPEWEIAGMPQATIDRSGHPLADDEGYGQARAAWLEQIETHKQSPAVMSNAFYFFHLTDKELAETALRRGQVLEPGNREWSAKLGWLYALGILGVTAMSQNGLCTNADPEAAKGPFSAKARKELETSSDVVILRSAGLELDFCGAPLRAFHKGGDESHLAEQVLEKAHTLSPEDSAITSGLVEHYKMKILSASTPEEKATLQAKVLALLEEADRAQPKAQRSLQQLTDLARAAFDAGDMEKAETYAKDLLQLGAQRPTDPIYGTAIHQGNLVLGRIALKKGDVNTAKSDLLAAGKTPGGGTLDSFGPNMALASELLERGEKQTVIEYLELCKSFWSYGTKKLQGWIDTIRSGGMPQFGPNLIY